MRLTSQSFVEGARIPGEYAFGVMDRAAHVVPSTNRNPHLAWSDVPAGAKSFVLICHDPDVPSRGDDVNQEGREIPVSLPRVDFFHWTLVDIAASTREIAAGEFSNGITPGGKPGPQAPHGTRQGINDFTASDAPTSDDHFGYDGPCPPWNDAITHRYVFTLYALDTPHLAVSSRFTGLQARHALQGHVLAQAALTGTYTLNPRLA